MEYMSGRAGERGGGADMLPWPEPLYKFNRRTRTLAPRVLVGIADQAMSRACSVAVLRENMIAEVVSDVELEARLNDPSVAAVVMDPLTPLLRRARSALYSIRSLAPEVATLGVLPSVAEWRAAKSLSNEGLDAVLHRRDLDWSDAAGLLSQYAKHQLRRDVIKRFVPTGGRGARVVAWILRNAFRKSIVQLRDAGYGPRRGTLHLWMAAEGYGHLDNVEAAARALHLLALAELGEPTVRHVARELDVSETALRNSCARLLGYSARIAMKDRDAALRDLSRIILGANEPDRRR